MYVNHSGWSQEKGAYYYDIFVDETKTDYELHFADGFIGRQTSPFEEVTADWNCDGDRYTQFGAWFESRFGGSTFWTPVQMISALLAGREETGRDHPDRIKDIPGILIPRIEKRPSLATTIHQSEQRTLHKEIERNRKMSALGIRQPGEPWAK